MRLEQSDRCLPYITIALVTLMLVVHNARADGIATMNTFFAASVDPVCDKGVVLFESFDTQRETAQNMRVRSWDAAKATALWTVDRSSP